MADIRLDAFKIKAAEVICARHGVARTKELTAEGISYKTLLKLVEAGALHRAQSGYYMLRDGDFSEEDLVGALFSDGVLTMESALFYHGYMDEKPAVWQIAVSKNTSKSRFKNPPVPVEPFYTEERVLPIGAEPALLGRGDGGMVSHTGTDAVDVQERGGVSPVMRVYGIDRLICDVLKYEEKLDRGVFRAAVHAYIDDEKKDVAKLLSYAKERKVLKKVQSMIGVWL